MRESRRPLLLTAVLTVTVAAGAATAQTIVVTKAPPGATVELGLNAAVIGTAKADAAGMATLPVNLTAHGRRAETDVRIFVDVCDQARRVTLVEAGWQAAAAAPGCARQEIFGVFYVRAVTTIVVNASDQAQAVWIKQGPAPEAWLRDVPAGNPVDDRPALAVSAASIFFGGRGAGKYLSFDKVVCGPGYSSCSSDETQLAFRLGGDYSIRRTSAYRAPT